MRTNRPRPALADAAVLLLALAMLFAGCGASGTATPGGSDDFFQQARENLGRSSSFRMTGTMAMELSAAQEAMSIDYGYDMWLDHAEDGSPLIKIHMVMSSGDGGPSGEAQEIAVEAYITADRIYMNDPATGAWGYQDLAAGGGIAQMTQDPTYMTPTRIRELLDAAETVELASEDSGYATYRLTMDPERAADEEQMAAAMEMFEQQGVSEEYRQAYLDVTRSVFSAMRLTVRVEKATGLPARCEIDFGEGLLERMAPLFADNPPPEGSRMTVNMAFDFSDFGADFGIELPEGARNAAPLQQGGGRTSL